MMWEDGITYRNVYERGALGGYICANRDAADKHVSADLVLEPTSGRRIGVVRITAKRK